MIEKLPGAVDHLVFGKHTPNTRWFYYAVYVFTFITGLVVVFSTTHGESGADWFGGLCGAFFVGILFNIFDEGWHEDGMG